MSALAKKPSRIENETLEGVRIMWRNFEGREGQFNAAGDRNFVVFLEDDKAEELASKGWTIKHTTPREEGDEPKPFIKVKIKYSQKARPPRVVMITGRGRNNLTEDMLMILDWVDIENVDLIIRPYSWDIRGSQGVTAYLQAIYVTIREDALEKKYADVPELESGRQLDSAQKAITGGNEFEDMGELEGDVY